ncbi:hypothetical protein PMAYCL1PPCAC_04937 [Pristionchus mayeri]|uniref:Mesoderm induction early response protein 1 n=1 Tax=Pristionchus mayeri TaxID=1317129 RepID=A0AAN5C9G1_9BILA|nr:hypothetical protein PMAYCL1PPCAC_04937 [Pristionchus mayeri]
MDPRDSELPDHPEDPFQPEEQMAPPPPPPLADEDAEDFVDDENEEDDEATLDEEEAMIDDDEDELDDLEAEADIDIEELRKKYGYGAPAPTEDDPCMSSTAEEAEAEDEEESESCYQKSIIPVRDFVKPIMQALESATNNYFGVAENEAEEEDVDYEPPEKKEFQIRVDPLLYQAAVPETTEDADPSTCTEEHPQGTLLWSPNDELSGESLNRFVHEWVARRHGVQHDDGNIDSRDDEDALFALLNSAYSTSAAAAAFPYRPANQCEQTGGRLPTQFTAEERDAFENGFKDNYKNFRVIKESFVPSRTLGELINYYYHWKKTARFNEFRQRAQRRDFMTEVMDQMESKRRREEKAAEVAAAAAAAAAASSDSSAPPPTVIHSENAYEDEVEYEDTLAGSSSDEPPVDVWAAPPPATQLEQPTESA